MTDAQLRVPGFAHSSNTRFSIKWLFSKDAFSRFVVPPMNYSRRNGMACFLSKIWNLVVLQLTPIVISGKLVRLSCRTSQWCITFSTTSLSDVRMRRPTLKYEICGIYVCLSLAFFFFCFFFPWAACRFCSALALHFFNDSRWDPSGFLKRNVPMTVSLIKVLVEIHFTSSLRDMYLHRKKSMTRTTYC